MRQDERAMDSSGPLLGTSQRETRNRGITMDKARLLNVCRAKHMFMAVQKTLRGHTLCTSARTGASTGCPGYPCYIMHNTMECCRSTLRVAALTSIKLMLFSQRGEGKQICWFYRKSGKEEHRFDVIANVRPGFDCHVCISWAIRVRPHHSSSNYTKPWPRSLTSACYFHPFISPTLYCLRGKFTRPWILYVFLNVAETSFILTDHSLSWWSNRLPTTCNTKSILIITLRVCKMPTKNIRLSEMCPKTHFYL
jgi:hypothetical protein